MISLGFKPAKAEIQVSTPDDTVPGQHRADQGCPGRIRPAAMKEDVDFDHNTDELRACPNALHPRV